MGTDAPTDNQPRLLNQLWLPNALDAATKEGGRFENLKLWRPAIVDHLHWTSASTPDGDPDVIEAKWQSMVNHVQDIHEHDNSVLCTSTS